MENLNSDLAKQAVACKGWRPMPGMVDADGSRVLTVIDADTIELYIGGEPATRVFGGCEFVPDLTDPATLGCLLHLVRAAHGNPHLVTEWCTTLKRWYVIGVCANAQPTEAGALVAALEAAP